MSLRGVNLVMAVAGFIFSTLFISFLCIRLIVAHIQLATSSRSNLNSLECGFGGLEHHVIAKFPTRKYIIDTNFLTSDQDDSQCVICLAEYCKGVMLRILPNCNHFFHVICIDKWLSQHSTCPLCRNSLRDLKLISSPTSSC